MAQIGIVASAQLQLHDHYDGSSGGPVNTIIRVAAATTKMYSSSQKTTTNAAWTLLKRIRVDEASPGTCNITYDLSRTGPAGNVNGQAHIYRNGSSIWDGAVNNEVAGPTTFTDAAVAIDFQVGDLIEVWGQRVTAGVGCMIEAEEVLYTGYIQKLARRELAAYLALTPASDILWTALL